MYSFCKCELKKKNEQGSLEELGENTKQRLKRRSQSAQGNHDPNEMVVDSAHSANSSPRSRHPYKFLVAPLEMAVDALNMDNRYQESLGIFHDV